MATDDRGHRASPGTDDRVGIADPSAEPSGETLANPVTGMRQLVGEDFSVTEAIGGVRGLVESMAPGVVFVAVFLVMRSVQDAVIASVAVAVVAMAIRLVQRTPPTQAVSGLVGIAIGAIWAWWSGKASDFFAFGLWQNAAYVLACVISIVIGWPLVGVVVEILRMRGAAWRSVVPARKVYRVATWIWTAMFALRLAIQVPLYLQGDDAVGWLGTARLAMGVPLWAMTLYVTWLLVRHVTVEPRVAPAFEENGPRSD